MDRHGSRASNPDEALQHMGYRSELPRSLSMMSILGLYVILILISRARSNSR
jgi:hypothetical protein